MGDQDEFYIGWQDEAAAAYKHGRRKFFLVFLVVILLFGCGYLFVENNYVDNYFDYGNLIELEGTIIDYPVFGLRTEIDKKEITVPLVGFGKFDALPVLETIKKQSKNSELSSLKVRLKGTVIQYQDKTWMELTEGDKSVVSIQKTELSYKQKVNVIGSKSVAGEIVDPKCFFGVMNPAYGKIHRSCAIRCISGGIPPVLAIKENGNYVDYYFVTDDNGMPVNKDILQYVGSSVVLFGQVEQIDDWKLIKVDSSKKLSESVVVKLDKQLSLCALN